MANDVARTSGRGFERPLPVIQLPNAASTQHAPSPHDIEYPGALFAPDMDEWDLDLAFDGLDFMLPVMNSPVVKAPLFRTQNGSQPAQTLEVADGYTDAQALAISWPQEDGQGESMSDFSLPSTTSEDNRLIQHYLQSLQGYSKVTDHSKDTNLFLSAFSESLSFAPLFYAILAFSSAHLAMNDDSFNEQVERYGDLSEKCMARFRLQKGSSIEGLLSAIFVLVKKIHITGGSIESFLELMQMASDILMGSEGIQYLESVTPLGRRIIVRLCVLDARAASYRLGGGAFIRYVSTLPALSDLFTNTTQIDYTADGIVCLLQIALLRIRISDLENRIYRQSKSDIVPQDLVRMDEVTALYKLLDSHINMWEISMRKDDSDPHGKLLEAEEVSLDATSYRDCTILSALHSSRIYLHSVFVSISHLNLVQWFSALLATLLITYSRSHSPTSQSSFR